jgi:hypothetical protein
MNHFKTRTIENADGDEIEIKIPCVWEICSTCRGDGKHSNRLGAITSEEWFNEWDYEEREAYLNGAYDKTCEDCDGSGKVQKEQWESLPADIQKILEEEAHEEWVYQKTVEAERKFGC